MIGLILSPYGYVLTNNHVIDGAKTGTITLPTNGFSRPIVGSDQDRHCGFRSIARPSHIPLGDSAFFQVGELLASEIFWIEFTVPWEL